MSNNWTHKSDKFRYGIVIYNFFEEKVHRLRLSIGETVHILEENGGWYFGFSTKNKAVRGIFPRSYIHLVDSIIDKSGPNEVILKQPYIVQEITSVLREWGAIWKHLYITNNDHFRTIEVKMRELMECRSKIISGTLPIDELKQMKRLVTSKIDVGNKLLGLDMVVRDEQGNILNPEKTSTIQLYWQHQLASERICKAIGRKEGEQESVSSIIGAQCCHTLYLCVDKYACRSNDDVQLLAALYDAKEGRPFTENCLLLKNSSPADHISNIKLLFTDLGGSDLVREKVFFVCYVVKVGVMDKGSGTAATAASSDPVRRPFGVCALDVSAYFNMKNEESTEEKKHFVPFIQCEKESNLEGTLRKILTLKELSQKDHKNQGLYVTFKMLHGDLKQVREENRHLLVGNVSVARKMGFPEVILPGDVRNDLYLTLHSGEFSKGSKSTDKNVQVTITVCAENGQVVPGVMDTGWDDGSEYRSVVYYHEDKPRWAETCKVTVPIEDFKTSHLKFTFRHRSSNEAKDKNEKPFAISYVRLVQENGTTLRDEFHELLVYKVDHKKYEPHDTSYLSLPSTKLELTDNSKPSFGCFSLSSKDSFVIQTNVCSTKLTQNVDLLGLLNWTSEPSELSDSLEALMKVSGEEIVKFLQDVLDALFNILIQNTNSDKYDNMVFHCLLYIIGLVSDRKYQHFQPVLDLYIKESFSATLAHKKLMTVLKEHIDNANSADPNVGDILLKTMKSLQYCIRFIVTSRQLYNKLNDEKDGQEFDISFNELLQSIAKLMCYSTDVTLRAQGGCLKHLPSTIPDILTVFNSIQLSHMLTEIINNVPMHRLTKQKMMTLNDIVHSPLFLQPACRRVLLPVILHHTRDLLEATHEVELCVKILSDVMDLLFNEESGPTLTDISDIMMTILRTVIQSTIAMDREGPLVGNLMAVMLSVLRQMSAHHFEAYISQFPTKTDLLDFLMEILLVFKDLVSRPVYPKDWCEMIMLQNSVLLKSLRFFSHTIRDYFSQKFEYQAWNNFFHCAISFLTQPALQLELFSNAKRSRIIARYKDMRRETGFEIRSMWFNLGQHKIQFVPGLVGPFLEMTLIPETELRKATIPIFFDMMQCEFYLSRNSHQNHLEPKRDSTHMKANFYEFENEMIVRLDNLVEMGKGDEHYKELFHDIMTSHCENHSTMREQGLKFVRTICRLMEHLLEYRSIINDENKENKMSCTVNLLDFYSEINRKEMYIRYIYKLCDLHLECDNFTEAGYTLKLHSKLLSWSDAPLSSMLRSLRYPHAITHRQLKMALYQDILHYFDHGKMWECAVEVCRELCILYEDTDYTQLSALLRKMAQFYDNILLKLRPEPEYFRVAYYGRGFPAFLQNKVFIYRGKEYERLGDFSSRTLNQLPNAELMNTLTPPGPDVTDSSHQYVQINKVEPIMDEKKLRQTVGKPISEQILKYHRVNNVQKFKFSRPYHKREAGMIEENEFATLWLERNVLVTSYPLPGILRWFPVTSTYTYHLSPLANAIETMQLSNKSLRDLILQHKNDPTLPLNPLSMKLNGIVDAAVNGGINNYEKAFFASDYLETHEDDVNQVALLKELIANQIPLLEVGLRIHKELAPSSLQPFHQRLEHCFNQMQSHVVLNYGAKSCDIKYEPVSMRRQSSLTEPVMRLSTSSFSSTEARARVSSLTKSQVATLTTFVMSNISPLSTLSRASSVQLRSTPLRSLSVVGSSTLSRKEKKKKQQRSSSLAKEDDIAKSQWYTTEGLISQQLTPVRPVRGERSRPSSEEVEPAAPPEIRSPLMGTPVRRRLTLTNGTPNRNSIGTESTTSEEDSCPPPLPVKLRESDYCNLPDTSLESVAQLTPIPTYRVRNKPVPPEPIEFLNTTPPRPPKTTS